MEFISRKDNLDKKTVKEYFKKFRNNLPEYLSKASLFLEKEKLDFSFPEIDAMGIFYKSNYESTEKLGIDYDTFMDIFIAYCCEAWIHYFGGQYFDTVLKNDIAYGYPQMIEWGPLNYEWTGIAPHEWAIMMEEGFLEKLSLRYSREIDYFTKEAEWNFKYKK